MINENSKWLFVFDLIIIFTSFLLVFFHYQGVTDIPVKGALLIGTIIIIWFVICSNSNILKVNGLSLYYITLKDIFIGYSLLSTSTIAFVAIFGEFRPNDKLILYPLLFSYFFSSFTRFFYLVFLKNFFKKGYLRKSVLLIGSGYAARKIIIKIISRPEMGFRISGILAENLNDNFLKKFYLGGLDQFSNVIRNQPIDQVIIVKPLREENTIKRIIKRCEEAGVRFCLVPDFHRVLPKWTILHNFDEFPVIGTRNEPLILFRNQLIKRTFDIFISTIGIIVLFSSFSRCCYWR